MGAARLLIVCSLLFVSALSDTSPEAPPDAVFQRVIHSYQYDLQLPEEITELAIEAESNPAISDLVNQIDDAHICLLYDRVQAISSGRSFTESKLANCDFIPNASNRFQLLDKCSWKLIRDQQRGSYLWPVRLSESNLFKKLEIPAPELSYITEDDLIVHIIKHIGADAMKDPQVLMTMIEERARLHLINVLYHVPMTVEEIEPILPMLISFWSPSHIIDWSFLKDVTRLSRDDSATSLETFWQIPAVLERFHLADRYFVHAIYFHKLNRLNLLKQIHFPYLDEIVDALRNPDYDMIQPFVSQSKKEIDLQLFAELLTLPVISSQKQDYPDLILRALQGAPDSIWKDAALGVFNERSKSFITPEYLQGVLQNAIPQLNPVDSVTYYTGDMDLLAQLQERFQNKWKLSDVVAYCGDHDPEYLNDIVNTPNSSDGYTLLHFAIRNNYPRMLKALLSMPDIDLGTKNSQGQIAFDYFKGLFGVAPRGPMSLDVLFRHMEKIQRFFNN